MTEVLRVAIGETVSVDGAEYVVAGLRHRLVAKEEQVGEHVWANSCPPYFGVVGDEAPRLPLLTETDDDGRTVYWVSYLRARALLPAETRFPPPGLARRRFVSYTGSAGGDARDGRTDGGRA